MKIVDGITSIQFDVLGYQFPQSKKSKPNDYNYDANWLTIKVTQVTPESTNEYTDSCLLTYELNEVVSGIDNLIQSKQSGYISDFMEPYLKIAIAKSNNDFVFQLHFVCDTTGGEWKTVSAVETLSTQQLIDIKNEFINISVAYPDR